MSDLVTIEGPFFYTRWSSRSTHVPTLVSDTHSNQYGIPLQSLTPRSAPVASGPRDDQARARLLPRTSSLLERGGQGQLQNQACVYQQSLSNSLTFENIILSASCPSGPFLNECGFSCLHLPRKTKCAGLSDLPLLRIILGRFRITHIIAGDFFRPRPISSSGDSLFRTFPTPSRSMRTADELAGGSSQVTLTIQLPYKVFPPPMV